MNVVKIVVDELPERCRMCKFQSVRPVKNGLRMYCSLKDKMVCNLRVRPSWCPLEVEEVCEWVLEEYEMCISPHNNGNWCDKDEYQFCPTCGKRIKYVESEE